MFLFATKPYFVEITVAVWFFCALASETEVAAMAAVDLQVKKIATPNVKRFVWCML